MAAGLFVGFAVGVIVGFVIGTHDADKMYAYERDQHWHWFDKYIAAVTTRATRPTTEGPDSK